MSLESELRARLIADGGVAALISARVYPLILPQAPTYPALTYQRISGPRLHHLTGSSGRGVARIQTDSWAETYAAAQALAAAVRAALDGFDGLLSTLRAVVRLENERDLYEGTPEIYRVTQDWRVQHTD